MSRRRGQAGHQGRPWEELRHATLAPEMQSNPESKASCWINDRYQVIREEYHSEAFGQTMVYLSIKRRDKNPIRDWRHLQQIKDELIGEECEAIELYPAKSRLVDQANQFHLWGFKDPETRVPVGFFQRVVEGPEENGANGGVGSPRQREFEPGLTI